MACEACFNLEFSPTRCHWGIKPRQTNSLLRQMHVLNLASSNGCQKCQTLVRAASHFDFDMDDDAAMMIIVDRSGLVLLYSIDLAITLQIYNPFKQPYTLGLTTNIFQLSHSPDSMEAYAFIESCLDRCKGHSKCQSTTPNTPTRLIAVGSLQDTKVQLEETQSNFRASYVALSYCWGKSAVVKTTSQNYEAMKRGIELCQLPKTIQDAIHVTRRLKQQYIWVDALCIIQDSTSDWEVESAKMALIYRDAFLTIAVASSKAAGDGFLHYQHHAAHRKPPLEIQWQTQSKQQVNIGIRVVPNSWTHVDRDGDETDLPLLTRGWTLQESKLSRRMLTFTDNEIWWACQTELDCECGYFRTVSRSRTASNLASPYSITNPWTAYWAWQLIVCDYSDRALTNPLDKLPAISGIAHVIQGITKSEYIAGLWRDNLIEDLTWETSVDPHSNSSVAATAVSQYRGPTFSWVSVDSPVHYSIQGATFLSACTVVTAGSWVPGQNPLGRVQSAFVTLRGLVLTTSLQITKDGVRGWTKNMILAHDKPLSLLEDTFLEIFKSLDENGVLERSVRRSNHASSNTEAVTEAPISLLYLGYSYRSDIGGRIFYTGQRVYLALGKSPTAAGSFERLGIAYKSFKLPARDLMYPMPPDCDQALENFSEKVITIV